MNDNNGPRRIMTRPVQVVRAQANKLSSATTVLQDALNIVSEQVDILRVKSSQTGQLVPEDQKALTTYIKALIDINRDERDAQRLNPEDKDLSNLSNEELLELAKSKLLNKP